MAMSSILSNLGGFCCRRSTCLSVTVWGGMKTALQNVGTIIIRKPAGTNGKKRVFAGLIEYLLRNTFEGYVEK